MTRPRVLLVDDEEGVRFAVRDYLEGSDFEVLEADSCRSAREILSSVQPDAVILDYRLPDGTSLDLIPHIKRPGDEAGLIVLTGHGTIDLAVAAVKAGADQFMTKPVDLSALKVMLDRILVSRRSRKREAVSRIRTPPDPFLGTSSLIRQLRDDARRVAVADTPVLLQGETGSGKGVLADWIHTNSPRAAEPFVDLNCAGLSREFLESELFGHERGAYTGAISAKQGLLELADGGTLFLDEIGDMDAAVQAKLVKVVEEKRFRRLGDVRDRHSDVRLVCATHHDLPQAVAAGTFRRDLYYRISAFRLLLPALRQRVEDIPTIASTILQSLARDLGRSSVHLARSAMDELCRYEWPGNIRELRNVLERALLLSDSPELTPAVLRFDRVATLASVGQGTLAEVERAHILRVLEEEGGRVEQASKRLEISRSSLYEKLHDYGLR